MPKPLVKNNIETEGSGCTFQLNIFKTSTKQ